MITPEEHTILAQLAQLGLQKLAETTQAALVKCAPNPAKPEPDKKPG